MHGVVRSRVAERLLSGARPQGAVVLQTRTPPHGRGDLFGAAFDGGGTRAMLVHDEGDAPNVAQR